MLIEWSKAQLAETEVNDKIATDVREGMEKNQREFLLRQQLNAIRKELGEDEPDGANDYRTRVEQADLPEDVRKAALREVGKLERGSDGAVRDYAAHGFLSGAGGMGEAPVCRVAFHRLDERTRSGGGVIRRGAPAPGAVMRR